MDKNKRNKSGRIALILVSLMMIGLFTFGIYNVIATGDTIDDSAVAGTKVSVRNYALPSSLMIRQLTATKFITVWGDGAWNTDA